MRAEWATASILVSEIAWLDVARLLEMIRLLYCMFPGPNRRLSYTCMWPATFCTTYTMLITAVVNIVWYHGVSAIQERNGKSKKTKPACVLVSVLQNAKVSLKLAEWCHCFHLLSFRWAFRFRHGLILCVISPNFHAHVLTNGFSKLNHKNHY